MMKGRIEFSISFLKPGRNSEQNMPMFKYLSIKTRIAYFLRPFEKNAAEKERWRRVELNFDISWSRGEILNNMACPNIFLRKVKLRIFKDHLKTPNGEGSDWIFDNIDLGTGGEIMNNKGRIEFLIASISGTRGEILNKKGRIEFSITLISGTGGKLWTRFSLEGPFSIAYKPWRINCDPWLSIIMYVLVTI